MAAGNGPVELTLLAMGCCESQDQELAIKKFEPAGTHGNYITAPFQKECAFSISAITLLALTQIICG